MHNFRWSLRINGEGGDKTRARARDRAHETRFIYGASPYLSNDIFFAPRLFSDIHMHAPRARVRDGKPKLSYFTITPPVPPYE